MARALRLDHTRNPSKPLISLLVLISVCLLGISANCQILTTSLPTTPVQPNIPHDYIYGINEAVNPANGSVSIRIPVPVPAERSLNFPIYAFTYDSATQWVISMKTNFISTVACNTGNPGVTPYTSSCVTDVLGPYLDSPLPPGTDLGLINQGPNTFAASQNSYSWWPTDAQPVTCTMTANLIYEDYYGIQHPMEIIATLDSSNTPGCPTFGVTDMPFGGDEEYKAIFPGSIDGVKFSGLIDLHGNASTANAQNTVIEDPNGNARSSTGRSGSYTGFNPDRLLSTPAVQSTTMTFPGINGLYTYNYQTVQTTYALQGRDLTQAILGVPDTVCGGLSPPPNDPHGAVQSIILPDGRSYQFTYDSVYGLIKQITYPTGAWVQYTWAPNVDSEATTWSAGEGSNSITAPLQFIPGSNRNGVCFFRHDIPALQSRIVSYDGVNKAEEEDFVYSTQWPSDTATAWDSKTTTVTTIDYTRPAHPQSEAIYTYSSFPIFSALGDYMSHSGQAAENTITYKDFNGAVLKTVTKSWNTPKQLASQCETLNNGFTSGRFYTYAPYTWGVGSDGIAGASSTMNLTTLVNDLKEYDYGSVASNCTQPQTIPARETMTNYQTFANTPLWPQVTDTNFGITIPANPISDRPSQVKVMDHGTLIKETDFGYDESALSGVATPLIGHDDANYGPTSTNSRGNVTSVRQRCFGASQPCSDSLTTIAYDQTGKPTSSTDARNYTTYYSYADSYTSDGGSPSANTNTYLTKITKPPTNGVQHIQKFQYSLNQGVLRFITDENGNTSQFTYPDPWNRVKTKNYPDGGSISINYNDAGPTPSIVTTVATGEASGPNVTTQWMDAMGHPIQTQRSSGPGETISTDVTYDGMGLTYTISNPYMNSDTTHGITTMTYDAIGNKVIQTQPDNSFLQWCYNGIASAGQSNCTANKSAMATGTWVDYSDEVGNHWQQVSDALGRLTAVIEPDPASNALSLETDYQYDASNNLKQIDQWGALNGGGSDHVRSFVYDSLSRLNSASNPESGAISYGYDANGNLQSKTAPGVNGAPGSGQSTTISYSYDALNRVISKTYTNTQNTVYTPSSCYQYDQATSPGGVSIANPIGRLTTEWTQLGPCLPQRPANSFLTSRSILSYDQLGRVTSEQQCTPTNCSVGTPYSFNYGYDLAGNSTLASNGIGSISWQPQFDVAGRLQSITATTTWTTPQYPAQLFNATQYGAIGITDWTTGGSGAPGSTPALTFHKCYDSRLRVTGEVVVGGGGTSPTSCLVGN